MRGGPVRLEAQYRRRRQVFWAGFLSVLFVALLGSALILRACMPSLLSAVSARGELAVEPAEVTLCGGSNQQFVARLDGEVIQDVSWSAGGGIITAEGLYAAGNVPGDYPVAAGAGRDGPSSQATVHVVACTPLPTLAPVLPEAPTAAPATPTPAATATPAPTPEATDAQADYVAFYTDAALTTGPAGIDIRSASIGSDLAVRQVPMDQLPLELRAWAAPDELVLWMRLYDTLPITSDLNYDWLFVLDTDGNPGTGRAPGAARVSPDLGTEAAIGANIVPDLSPEIQTYFLVWDPQAGTWANGPEVVRLYIDETRTLLAVAISLETLTQQAAQISGVTVQPAAMQGRTAALVTGVDPAAVDYYPERP